MKIPDTAECYRLMRRYSMLPNIIEHSEQVMRVSLAVVDGLRPGTGISRELVLAAALLHDITKTRALTTGEPHDRSGAELLTELGLPEIAAIVGEHVFIAGFDPDGPLAEKEIVYYADKRVMHSTIVSVDERVKDLIERYGDSDERISLIIENKKLLLAVESKIVRFMDTDLQRAIDGIG